MTVLHACVTHIGLGNTREFRKSAGDPGRVGTFLFDLQVVVLAISGQLESEPLVNLKVGVFLTNLSGQDRSAVGALPVRQTGLSAIGVSVAGTTW